MIRTSKVARMSPRRGAVAALLVAAAGVVTACGSAPASPPSSAAGSTASAVAATPTAVPGEPVVTLRVPDGTPPEDAASALGAMARRAVELGLVSVPPVVGDATVELAPVDARAGRRLVDLATVNGAGALVPLGQEEVEPESTIDLSTHPPLATDAFESAKRTTSQAGGDAIQLALTRDAATALAAWSATHIGDYLAITIDDTVIVAPVVRDTIPDGVIEIELASGIGRFDLDTFIAVVNAGVMPVDLAVAR